MKIANHTVLTKKQTEELLKKDTDLIWKEFVKVRKHIARMRVQLNDLERLTNEDLKR